MFKIINVLLLSNLNQLPIDPSDEQLSRLSDSFRLAKFAIYAEKDTQEEDCLIICDGLVHMEPVSQALFPLLTGMASTSTDEV